MKPVSLIGLLACALASPTGADEPVSDVLGVWFGEHPALVAHSSAVLPSEGGRSALRELGSSGITGASNQLPSTIHDRGLLIVRLEADGDHVGGSMVLASPDRSKEARAVRALESLGIAPRQPLSGIRAWNDGPLTGMAEESRVSFTARMTTDRTPRRFAYAAGGELQGDELHLKVTNVSRQASMAVRLRRCVVPPGQTEDEACSDEAIWRRYVETVD